MTEQEKIVDLSERLCALMAEPDLLVTMMATARTLAAILAANQLWDGLERQRCEALMATFREATMDLTDAIIRDCGVRH